MGLRNATLNVGGTIAAATGGASKTYAEDDIKVTDGVHCTDYTTGTDARLFPFYFARSRPATYNKSTKGWGKARREVASCRPKLASNGEIIYPLIRVIFEDHPELVESERVQLLLDAAQIPNDADFVPFLKTGARS